MLTTSNFLSELALILRGDHPAWGGDCTMNADAFVRRIARDFDDAAAIARDIERNLSDCAEISGISPRGLRIAINTIREEINLTP